MKAKTNKIVPTFADDTSFEMAARPEFQLAAQPSLNESTHAPQIVMLLSRPERERTGVPYSALND